MSSSAMSDEESVSGSMSESRSSSSSSSGSVQIVSNGRKGSKSPQKKKTPRRRVGIQARTRRLTQQLAVKKRELKRPSEDAYWADLEKRGKQAFGVLEIDVGTAKQPLVKCMAWGLDKKQHADALAAFGNMLLAKDDLETAKTLFYLGVPRLPITFQYRDAKKQLQQFVVREEYIQLTNNSKWLTDQHVFFHDQIEEEANKKRKTMKRTMASLIKADLTVEQLRQRQQQQSGGKKQSITNGTEVRLLTVKELPAVKDQLVEHAFAVVDARARGNTVPDPPSRFAKLWKETIQPKLAALMQVEETVAREIYEQKRLLLALLGHVQKLAASDKLPLEMTALTDARSVYPPGVEPPSEEANPDEEEMDQDESSEQRQQRLVPDMMDVEAPEADEDEESDNAGESEDADSEDDEGEHDDDADDPHQFTD